MPLICKLCGLISRLFWSVLVSAVSIYLDPGSVTQHSTDLGIDTPVLLSNRRSPPRSTAFYRTWWPGHRCIRQFVFYNTIFFSTWLHLSGGTQHVDDIPTWINKYINNSVVVTISFRYVGTSIFRFPYFATSIFCFRYFATSIFCVRYFAIRYFAILRSIFCDSIFAFRYFVRNPFEHPPPPPPWGFFRIAVRTTLPQLSWKF